MSTERNEGVWNSGIGGAAAFLTVFVIIAAMMGCLQVWNATSLGEHPFYFVLRQGIWGLIGFFVLYRASLIPFYVYCKFVYTAAIFLICMLFLVLFVGTSVNGMRGWFSIGSIFIQPSEFVKPVLLLLLCVEFSSPDSMKKESILRLTLFFLAFALPVAMQPDIGTLVVYCAGFMIVYWLSGAPVIYMIFSLPVIVGAAGIFLIKYPYIWNRLCGFWNPEADPLGSGWHIRQFQVTLARGGWTGSEYGQSIWSNSYLPLPHTDSAFASLIESSGALGGVLALILICGIALSAFFMASNVAGRTERLFIASGGSLIFVQSLIHMGVNVAIIPPSGITLPLFSYGGSSLISTLFCVGIILSAAKNTRRNDLTVPPEQSK